MLKINYPTVTKVVENKLSQVVEKSSNLFLNLFGFIRAMKFRDSREFFRTAFKMLRQRVASLVNVLCKL